MKKNLCVLCVGSTNKKESEKKHCLLHHKNVVDKREPGADTAALGFRV
jgi:hypothetical protein